ncbi:MAG: hypothetical protein GY773_21315, partial [Actinomycetia bacterium]|nr:hypothetical protein [Actinomycetes bacterium]
MVILLVLAIAAAVVVGFAIGWFLVNQGQSVAPDHHQELAASVDRAVEVL